MPDTRALADLVVARSQTSTHFLTFRGLITARPSKNYVSLVFGGGAVYGDRLVDLANNLNWTFRAICVGYTDSEALYVADKFRALFANWRPVSDLSTGWFTETQDNPPVIKDESTLQDVRYSVSLRYRITTPRST